MSDEERKRLVWNIKKKVYTSNTGELFQLTKDICAAPDADVTPLKDGDEESYINYIVTYMHRCELSRLPDQGILVLMNLNECIDEIVEKRARTENVTQPSIAFHNTDISEDEYQIILSNQGSRVRPIWLHVRPNFSRVRLKKISRRTSAPSRSKKIYK